MSIDNDKTAAEISKSGFELIFDPLINKGMAFNEQERRDFDLLGILPPQISSMELQRQRSYETFKNKATALEKYLYLRDLQDSNEILFYNLLLHHMTEMMPIVYTPTVGLGCQLLSHIYRHPRGVYLAYPFQEDIAKILANPRYDKVKVIVVSDGERILGLGDQGAGGMGIPIGKLSLYVACAGIHPAETLPILLDTGTDNQELLDDPLYIGWRNKRIRGKQYDDFIATFVNAVKQRFPNVLLQWEDFAQINANPILQRYRDELCTFNDDIQGTAAIAVATLLSAIQVTKTPLTEQRVVVVGAGSAGCGISSLMLEAMVDEGLSHEEAASRFYLIDRNGLLVEGMSDILPFQKPFLQSKARISEWQCQHKNTVSLLDVVKNIHPTVLLGVSGQPGIFDEIVVSEMAAHVERPVIFPLSNPTSRSEATPEDLMRWTAQRALIGTGSPFDAIIRHGKAFRVDQTNNCYIFPGMGLGLIAVKATKVTDKMFMTAAQALAECSPAKIDATANLLPPLTEIREVSLKVAIAVAKEAIESGFADANATYDNVEQLIRTQMWEPNYVPYRKK